MSKPIPDAPPTLDALPEATAAYTPPARSVGRSLRSGLRFLALWAWRFLWGAVFGMHLLAGVPLIGWLQRWTRRRVLLAWYRRSGKGDGASFDAWYESWLPPGPEAPTSPRFFLREGLHRFRQTVNRPVMGRPPGPLTIVRRVLVTPIHALLLNCAVGARTLLCTFLVVGPGCLLMLGGWEFGWLNSFSKGYEQAFVGPATSLLGIALFVAAMFYVPLAQVHLAVVGRARAFFDVRLIRQLTRARPLGCLFLALGMTALGLLLQGLKTAPSFFPWTDFAEDAMPADYLQAQQSLNTYYFWCSLTLFVGLVLTRLYAARLYRTALLTALRRGDLARSELPAELMQWLHRLGGVPSKEPEAEGFELFLRGVLGRFWRTGIRVALALTWFVFIGETYVGEFLNVHPVIGFLNQPQVLLPTFDYVPADLAKDARGEGGPYGPPQRSEEGDPS